MNKIPGSEDEDDIESLRIAALQSLKRNNSYPDIPGNSHSNFRTAKGSRNKWGRFNHPGRPVKSGHNRTRNTNLISITPVSDKTETTPNNNVTTCSSEDKHENNFSKETCSKFNRYDQSDKSESESEEKQELEQKDTEDLEKADSLEFLMKELDSEIQGQNEEKGKLEKNNLEQNVEAHIENPDNNPLIPEIDKTTTNEGTYNKPIGNSEVTSSTYRKRPKSRSPLRGMYYQRKHNRRGYPIMNQQRPSFNPINQFEPQLIPFMNNPQPHPLMMHSTFNPPPIFSPFFDRPISPLTINTESLTTAARAPLSPRSAAFVLQNKAIIEKRKRSPRRSFSRSPTRSLSRSPRRSLSPIRRSLTPIRRSLTPTRRFRRSVSPRRYSRSPKRFSPRKRSLSPKRRSLSPKRRSLSPKRRSLTPKRKFSGNLVKGRPVHDRLGQKSDKPEENRNKPKIKEVSNEEPTDPILAARKKKFESNELKKKEGIIRLKPKDEKFEIKNDEISSDDILQIHKNAEELPVVSKGADETVEPQKIETSTELIPKSEKEDIPQITSKTESSSNEKEDYDRSKDPEEFKELERLLNDDAILEDLLDPKVADIFSDEESASDNEGRFKAKTKHGKKVPVLSFNKLVNGEKPEIKTEALSMSSKSSRHRQNEQKSKKSLSVMDKDIGEKKKTTKSLNNESGRQKITIKSEKSVPAPIEKVQDQKIEIKIKHPSKYQKSSKSKLHKSESDVPRIQIQDDISESSISENIIIEDKDDSGDEENAVLTQGDLRTQLSRKRAEKLYKLPREQESVSSRILQYALQGALFKKSKKSKRKVVSTQGVSGIQGSKLPIHFRLGISNTDEVVEEVKIKKKKKRKVHELLEQV